MLLASKLVNLALFLLFCLFAEPYLPPNEFELLNSVLGDGIHKDKEMGISAVAFDAHEELLWMGTRSGHVRLTGDMSTGYSNHLNTGLVRYSNDRFVSGCQMVCL